MLREQQAQEHEDKSNGEEEGTEQEQEQREQEHEDKGKNNGENTGQEQE